MQKGYNPERPYHPCCDGNRGESESVICRSVVLARRLRLARPTTLFRDTFAQWFNRQDLHLLNHIVLYVRDINIILFNAHLRGPPPGSFQASRIILFMVRASSSGRDAS